MGNSRMEVWQRRREVTSLIVRGLTSGEIAVALGISPETVYNDTRVIKSGGNEALNAHTRNELNAQLYLNAKERIRELWRMFENATTESIQLRVLQELRLNDERILKRLPPLKTLEQTEYYNKSQTHIQKIIDKLMNDQDANHGLQSTGNNPKAPSFNGGVDASPGLSHRESHRDSHNSGSATAEDNSKAVGLSHRDSHNSGSATTEDESENENPPDHGDKDSQ